MLLDLRKINKFRLGEPVLVNTIRMTFTGLRDAMLEVFIREVGVFSTIFSLHVGQHFVLEEDWRSSAYMQRPELPYERPYE